MKAVGVTVVLQVACKSYQFESASVRRLDLIGTSELGKKVFSGLRVYAIAGRSKILFAVVFILAGIPIGELLVRALKCNQDARLTGTSKYYYVHLKVVCEGHVCTDVVDKGWTARTDRM